MLKVFVYGTLKPGEKNYDRYCREWVLTAETATAFGQLYDLPCGYPAMTPGQTPVHGFLLSFNNPDVLLLLDELEDFCPNRPAEQNEYLRVKVEVYNLNYQPLGEAWAYQMDLSRVQRLGGIFIPDGKWA